MIISHSQKFIFFKPPKTAGSSIEEALSKHCKTNDVITADLHRKAQGIPEFFNHAGPKHLRQYFSNELDHYKVISAVRNPWDKMVSEYWWFRIGIQKQEFTKIAWEHIKQDFRTYYNSIFIYGDPANHIQSNTLQYLFDIEPDYIIRFESIEKDYKLVCDSFKFPVTPLERLKSKTRLANCHYSKYYTQEMLDQMRIYIQPVLDRFNYKFERPSI